MASKSIDSAEINGITCLKWIEKIKSIPCYDYYSLMNELYLLKEDCKNLEDNERLEKCTEELIKECERQDKLQLKAILLGHQSENLHCRETRDSEEYLKTAIVDKATEMLITFFKIYSQSDEKTLKKVNAESHESFMPLLKETDKNCSNHFREEPQFKASYSHVSVSVKRFLAILFMNRQEFGNCVKVLSSFKNQSKNLENSKDYMLQSSVAYSWARYHREMRFYDHANFQTHREESEKYFALCLKCLKEEVEQNSNLQKILEPDIVMNTLQLARVLVDMPTQISVPYKEWFEKTSVSEDELTRAKRLLEKIKGKIDTSNRSRIHMRFQVVNMGLCYRRGQNKSSVKINKGIETSERINLCQPFHDALHHTKEVEKILKKGSYPERNWIPIFKELILQNLKKYENPLPCEKNIDCDKYDASGSHELHTNSSEFMTPTTNSDSVDSEVQDQ